MGSKRGNWETFKFHRNSKALIVSCSVFHAFQDDSLILYWELLDIWSWPSHCFILTQQKLRRGCDCVYFHQLFFWTIWDLVQEQLICKLSRIPFTFQKYLRTNSSDKPRKWIKESHTDWIRVQGLRTYMSVFWSQFIPNSQEQIVCTLSQVRTWQW